MSRPSSRTPGISLERVGVDGLEWVRELAAEIWRAVYPEVISSAQIEYMLERMYALEAMRREVSGEAVDYFLVRSGESPAPIGFAALGPGETAAEVFLHKLYLLPEFHGRGYGSAALRELEEIARRRRSAKTMLLRVNRANHRAIRAYSRNGFEIAGEVCSEIGGGFVMDDYWMRKGLAEKSAE